MIALLAAAVAVLLGYLWFTTNRLSRRLSWLSGPPTLPLLGNAWDFLGLSQAELFKLGDEWIEKYGPKYLMWVGPKPYVVTAKQDDIQGLTKIGKDVEKSIQYKFLAEFTGGGLLTSSGEKWFKRRKQLTECFHFSILTRFLETMNNHAVELVGCLAPIADSGQVFDFLPLSKKVTLDIIMDTSMGIDVGALRNDKIPIVDAIETLTSIIISRTYTLLFDVDFIYNLTPLKKKQEEVKKVVMDFSRKAVDKRRSERRSAEVQSNSNQPPSGKQRLALLDLMLDLQEKGEDISDEEIIQEINTFVFAGHDTTAAAISFTLFLLGLHSDIQTEVAAEVRSILEPGQAPTHQQLAGMELLERCIKESLRLYTPVSQVGRKLTCPFATKEGTVPSGVNVVLELDRLHRSEKNFPEPEKFMPDRFLQEPELFSFLPFSAGPRNCIGQRFAMLEMKTVLSQVLSAYEVESVDKKDELRLKLDIVLTSEQGIRLKFKRRP